MTEIKVQQSAKTRPPVVVVLGHVDHGKTMLLDTIRKTNVAGRESGGITQHIGAYQVSIETGDERRKTRLITFLDTPGHEAFTAIRSRGAKVADIAVLVVAADESVKPQTQEAIKIIKELGLPVIIAVNKIDKEGAQPQKVKQDLASEDILVEEWGGKVPAVEISAKEGRNIKELLDMILLVAELEELREDLSRPAQGIIIESHLDKRRGYVATALVQKGILKLGDWMAVGTAIGKVKSLEDFTGKPLSQAGPSQPVRITGWSSIPDIGREFTTADSKEKAQRIQEEHIDLHPLFLFFKEPIQIHKDEQAAEGNTLCIILKADVWSSLEAIESALKAIPCDQVRYKCVSYDIGNISESDIKTAISTQAVVLGFRVDVENSAKKLAEREHIYIAVFDVIYELIAYVRERMSQLLEPEVRKISLGKLTVLALFKQEGKYQVVGGKVTSGKAVRGSTVSRADVKIGKIAQLQQNKEDVSEVRQGLEAGLKIELIDPNIQINEGDILELYEEEKIERSL